ncbi:MAG: carbonic anhydrase [Clostridia bacterium]|nr:carbonic anhydrase [Clostridia bacterium]
MLRNKYVKMLAIVTMVSLAIALNVGCSKPASTDGKETGDQIYKRQENISSGIEARKLLVDGNKRFVEGSVLKDDLSEEKRKELSSKGQKPFAAVVSCSDSRVPPEVVFDQALGDIFVIRDAGNVVDPVALGSVEYGAEHLHIPLIVVLGHEKCGAVKATVEGGEAPGSIKAIVEKIHPSFEKVKSSTADKEVLCEKCADENIKNTIAEIKKSPIIKKLEEEKKVLVVGAKYHIESGEVTFSEEDKVH